MDMKEGKNYLINKKKAIVKTYSQRLKINITLNVLEEWADQSLWYHHNLAFLLITLHKTIGLYRLL